MAIRRSRSGWTRGERTARAGSGHLPQASRSPRSSRPSGSWETASPRAVNRPRAIKAPVFRLVSAEPPAGFEPRPAAYKEERPA